MQIVPIESADDADGIKQFLQVASQVYRNDPIWVPESEKSFLDKLKAKADPKIKMWPFIALEDNLPVARGAAISVGVAKSGNPQGWIGFFESVSGYQDSAIGLLKRCEEVLRKEGVKSLLAPKVDNLLVGLLVDGFSLPQTVLTNHNPPYYLELFRKCGYEIKTRLGTFIFTRETIKQQQINIPGFTTREFNRHNLPQEVAIFHRLQNLLFESSDDYVPRTLAEDHEMVTSFLPFLDDEMIIIAQDKQANPAGLLICFPDIYQTFRGQSINRARIVSIGVLPGRAMMGLGAMMGSHLMRNLLKKGYQSAEASWILQNNLDPQNLAKRFNAQLGRQFVLLHKNL
jgi:hypothetical protein